MKTIDPKKVIVSFMGKTITGYADGEFIGVESNDAFADQTGADGEFARVKSNDTSGEATITLMQTSKSNQDLSTLHTADLLTGVGVGPFSITDLMGSTLVFSAEAYIKKKPKVSFSKGVETRAWIVKLPNAVFNIGGN